MPSYLKYNQLIDSSETTRLEEAFNANQEEGFVLRKSTFALFRDKTWGDAEREAVEQNWKVHISVASDDLERAWDLLYPLLCQHVKQFKVIDNARLAAAQKEQCRRLQEARSHYETCLLNPDLNALRLLAAQLSSDRADYQQIQNDLEALQQYVNQRFQQKLQTLQDQVAEGVRVAEGMQMTLYLLPGTEQAILPILKEIELLLREHHIQPGHIFRTDRIIGDYCSVRHPGRQYQDALTVNNYNPDAFPDPFGNVSDITHNLLRKTEMTRKIALLDVDETLLYGAEGQINTALIDELMSAGIHDVYLFTNMELKDISSFGRDSAPYSRYELVNHLQSRGLNVLGVLTPADRYLSINEPGVAYRTIYTPLMEKRQHNRTALNLADYTSAETVEFLFANLRWKRSSLLLNEQSKLNIDQHANVPCMGLRLINKNTREKEQFLTQDEAIAFFSNPEHCQNYCLDFDINPLDVTSIVGSNNKNLKGMMMEHFLSLPGMIQTDTTLYFFDDRADFIAGVQKAVDDHNHTALMSVRLLTCLMPQNLQDAAHPAQRLAYQQCLNGQSVTALPDISQQEIQRARTAEPTPTVSASLLLKILSHPVTKVVGAIVLLAGIAGIVVGSCGLAGVAIGIPALLAKVLLGVGAGGTAVSAVGFFAGSKTKSDEGMTPQLVL